MSAWWDTSDVLNERDALRVRVAELEAAVKSAGTPSSQLRKAARDVNRALAEWFGLRTQHEIEDDALTLRLYGAAQRLHVALVALPAHMKTDAELREGVNAFTEDDPPDDTPGCDDLSPGAENALGAAETRLADSYGCKRRET